MYRVIVDWKGAYVLATHQVLVLLLIGYIIYTIDLKNFFFTAA